MKLFITKKFLKGIGVFCLKLACTLSKKPSYILHIFHHQFFDKIVNFKTQKHLKKKKKKIRKEMIETKFKKLICLQIQD